MFVVDFSIKQQYIMALITFVDKLKYTIVSFHKFKQIRKKKSINFLLV